MVCALYDIPGIGGKMKYWINVFQYKSGFGKYSNSNLHPSEEAAKRCTTTKFENYVGTFSVEVPDMNHNYDKDWFYCPDCNEEYELPEDTDECPICGSDQIAMCGAEEEN